MNWTECDEEGEDPWKGCCSSVVLSLSVLFLGGIDPTIFDPTSQTRSTMKKLGMRTSRTFLISVVLVVVLLYNLVNSSQTRIQHQRDGDQHPITNQNAVDMGEEGASAVAVANADMVFDTESTPFMPQMANETLKAELGNAAWKLLHTILARYPEAPVESEKVYLKRYIESFAQVYPCGDCARHFIKLLQRHPPQIGSRKSAALWGCFIHNQVNKRLAKPQYDCTTILEDYDCGCGADEQLGDEGAEMSKTPETPETPETSPRLGSRAKTAKPGRTGQEDRESRQHLDSIRVESSEERVGG